MKTHYEIVISDSTECDPDVLSQIACGRHVSENLTSHRDLVTCKNCLKVILNSLSDDIKRDPEIW